MNYLQASILTIGDELLSGEVVDTNSTYLAEHLQNNGFKVGQMFCVGDELSEIVRALENCVDSAVQGSLVIVTGGLGPTTDDLTRVAVAKFCRVELELSQTALEKIKAYFAKRKRPFAETNSRQAYFPHGAEIIENPVGTADSFAIEAPYGRGRQVTILCLPGIPREVKEIWRQKLVPWFDQRFPNREKSKFSIIKSFGLSESYIGSRIEQAGLPENIKVSYRPVWPELLIKFSLTGEVAKDQQKQLLELAVEKAITQISPAFVYSNDENESMADCVGKLLQERKLTLAVAESCTGGEIASRIVSTPGASTYFLTSVVSYSNEAKEVFLGVTLPLLENYGAVSEEVVKRMAQGVRSRIGSDIGLAVTGIAGPGGGTAEKPEGTVWIGLVTPDAEQTFCYFIPGERNMFRSYCAVLALDLVRRKLLGYPLEWERK